MTGSVWMVNVSVLDVLWEFPMKEYHGRRKSVALREFELVQ